MALLDSCRTKLRIRTNALDEEIVFNIGAARQELVRLGVPKVVVFDEMNDNVTQAIRTYVQAFMDKEAIQDQYMESFRLQADELRKSILGVDSCSTTS